MIKIENLHKKYGDIKVLDGINLSAKKGEVIAVIGPSGTGKSTLLRCINFLEYPDQGTIQIDEVIVDSNSVTKSNIQNLRKKSAMIFQEYNLFLNKNVLQNVTLPLIIGKKMNKNEAIEIAMDNLKRVGMDDKIHQYPLTLSGGQQQRVAIARSLSVEPTLLLFDEPTSALDPEWIADILNLIKSLVDKEHTMIIVTHEMHFARDVADRIIFMENGMIIEEGTPQNIFEDPQNYRTKLFLKNMLIK